MTRGEADCSELRITYFDVQQQIGRIENTE